MNEEISRKVEELIESFKNNQTYQKFMELRKTIYENEKAMELIEDIKTNQKKAIHNLTNYNYDQKIKNDLESLREICPYEEFLNIGDNINKTINEVTKKLNDFFETSVN